MEKQIEKLTEKISNLEVKNELLINKITALIDSTNSLIKACEEWQEPNTKHATAKWLPLNNHNYSLEEARQAVAKSQKAIK